MYLYTYGNPLLQHSLKKVFWTFPSSKDPPKKWNRLSKTVVKQVKWLNRPLRHTDKKYKQTVANMDKEEEALADAQYNYAKQYQQDKFKMDLECCMVNYVDLK
jgi:hypothetical protein